MDSKLSSLFFCLILAGSLRAQTAPPTADKAATTPAKTQAASESANLPSESTVNSFLQDYFGNQQGVTWKILGIKPAKAPALADVAVMMSGPQGQQVIEFYVTPDEKHALVG